MTTLDQLAQRGDNLPTVTQTTAVEQARAIAEVQAAVVVAQNCPRDISRAVAEMRDACGRMALASRAKWTVGPLPRLGTA